MSIKNQLSEILGYFGATRGIGHTTAVIKGFNTNPMPIAVTASSVPPNTYNAMFGSQNWVSLDQLQSLQGVKRPLVFDNSALHNIFDQALDTIIELENENRLLRDRLECIIDVATGK